MRVRLVGVRGRNCVRPWAAQRRGTAPKQREPKPRAHGRFAIQSHRCRAKGAKGVRAWSKLLAKATPQPTWQPTHTASTRSSLSTIIWGVDTEPASKGLSEE